ncbi:TonB-dependent Receptor Plug Domain protein [bacterium BMS3Bbin03]|nr:TonB-dependent Receptor Plug Domain protein [bacterium BMS3Bbin03]
MIGKLSNIKDAGFLAGLIVFLVLMDFGMLRASDNGAKKEAEGKGSVIAFVGKITGSVYDSASGDPLPGVNVIIDGTRMGAATDLDGRFLIRNVPVGNYSLTASMIGYARVTIKGVRVYGRKSVVVNFVLLPEALQGEAVVVEASPLTNTEAALLRNRQKAEAVSDAISAEAMSHFGTGDASEAMKLVTGASVVDGKYVYIRGIGERYTNTQLNGAALPSTDPDRKAVQMDIFPSNLLENVIIVKTFTPDQPGNFSGGIVNIQTKNYPENLTIRFSSSSGYNSQTTLNSHFLTAGRGKYDGLALGDRTRHIPDMLQSAGAQVPDIGYAWTNRSKALKLDHITRAFNSVMAPEFRKAPANQRYSLSVGNQGNLFGRPFGYLASLTYNHTFSYYNHGVVGRWQLTGKVSEVDSLNADYLLSDEKGSENVLIGGLGFLSYKPSPDHNFRLNYLFTRSGESTARYLEGAFPRDLSDNAVYETRTLRYTQREIRSTQIRGEHYLKNFLKMSIYWEGSLTNSYQKQPDLRFFTDNYTLRNRGGKIDTIYAIRPSIYPVPTRYFRNLNENNKTFNLKTAIPFSFRKGLTGKFKFGGAVLTANRTFHERRFEYDQDKIRYDGHPSEFFMPGNVGIVDSTHGLYRFGNYIRDASERRGNYGGTQTIRAGFGMVDLPVFENFRVIAGARYETTRMEVASRDISLKPGKLKTADWLPSLNVVYNIVKNTNLRLAYGRTLARPTFREMAPYASFDFVNDYFFVGNAKLKRTLIDNFDLRWEWFPNPGEILAVSGFYKGFKNPIERAILNVNGEVQFQNVDKAAVVGAEFEVRKHLGNLIPQLSHFQLGANVTLAHSRVAIPKEELLVIRNVNPNADDSRPLQGQSPYILNFDLVYSNEKIGTVATAYYNVFGERVAAVSMGGTPNVFELSQPILNLTISQHVWRGFRFSLSAKNLLNPAIRKVHHFKGKDYITEDYKRGRNISAGISYDFNK